mmetsp:Transcript_28829/g.66621  ORF Transcript_28829/g.66621 Transcript_28829/m.66621 type:complete len:271 (+) Transcript_28829:268-1080(+)
MECTRGSAVPQQSTSNTKNRTNPPRNPSSHRHRPSPNSRRPNPSLSSSPRLRVSPRRRVSPSLSSSPRLRVSPSSNRRPRPRLSNSLRPSSLTSSPSPSSSPHEPRRQNTRRRQLRPRRRKRRWRRSPSSRPCQTPHQNPSVLSCRSVASRRGTVTPRAKSSGPLELAVAIGSTVRLWCSSSRSPLRPMLRSLSAAWTTVRMTIASGLWRRKSPSSAFPFVSRRGRTRVSSSQSSPGLLPILTCKARVWPQPSLPRVTSSTRVSAPRPPM